MWIADGTFRVVPSLFFQLYTVHFEFLGNINPVAIYCLLMNKTRATYDRLIEQLKQLIPTAAPGVILVDFEQAAIQAFSAGFPQAQISACYFHLCQSVLRKVNDIGMKADYESNDELRGFVRCLAALSHVRPADVLPAFEALVNAAPPHERMNELLTYFEQTYVRGKRVRGRAEVYGQPLYPIETWNKFLTAGVGIARTTNAVEGWHFGLQSLLLCAHPTMWLFLEGLLRDCERTRAKYLQAVAGAVEPSQKRYRDLRQRVLRAVNGYGQSDVLTYLRAIAHLSYQ